VRILRRWHRQDTFMTPTAGAFVVHYNGKPVTRIKRTWKQACHIAGLHGVTPHTLRHTRATWMMQEGIPIWEAAGALGMTPEMLTGTYGKHHPDFQKRAAEV
jgi:integrase